jgi:hypothetical protein
MKTLIQKLHSKIEAYFVSRWWERKFDEVIDEAYKRSGDFCSIIISREHRLALGFETLSKSSDIERTVDVYESDLGCIAYSRQAMVEDRNNG